MLINHIGQTGIAQSIDNNKERLEEYKM